VVQELDGLKASSRRLSNGERDDALNRVAALARGVNRAMVHRLDAQHRGVDTRIAASSSTLEVQGPGDAASCRLEMKARGFLFGGDGVERVPAGDEEILFFCRTRRERGELVAFVTADANAAVSRCRTPRHTTFPCARSTRNAFPKTRTRCTPRSSRFTKPPPREAFRRWWKKTTKKPPRKKASLKPESHPMKAFPFHRGPTGETRVGAPESKNKGGPSETRVKERGAGGPSVSPRATKNQNVSPPVSPPSSPRAHAVRVLEALDLALPAAVEFMLREALGDLWAAGVSDDFDAQNVSLCADDAFEALRKNRASLLLPNKSGGAFGTKRGADAGREAMRALALARNARGRHNELKELGSIERASQIADIVCDLLVNCPNAVPEVATAAEAAARAKRALARDKLIGS
jgi:hypothetical protein